MWREKSADEDIAPSQMGRRLLERVRKEAMRKKFEATRNKHMMEVEQNDNGIEEEQTIKGEEVSPIQQEYLTYLMKHNLQHPESLFSHLKHFEYPQYKVYFEYKEMIIFDQILGKGSFGVVRQGINKFTGQKIAAKQMEYFQKNELKCLKELNSEYIIKIIDYFQYNGKCYIIFQYCDGNLKQELKKCNHEIQKVLSYFDQIIFGIDVLQSKNIIHRDLKFENILVKDGKVKISDFGFAKFLGNELEVESRKCGTQYTMAPEIYFSNSKKAPYTRKTDIWAIGVMLHEMLYRMHPFRGMINRVHKGSRVPIQRKFGILDRIIDKCLVKSPSQRINWNEFMNLFDLYMQQKLQYCQEQQRNRIFPDKKEEKKHQEDQGKIIVHPRKGEDQRYSDKQDRMRDDSIRQCKQRTPQKLKKQVKKNNQERDNHHLNKKQTKNCRQILVNQLKDIIKSPQPQKQQHQQPIPAENPAQKPLDFNEIQSRPLPKPQRIPNSHLPIRMHEVVVLLLMLMLIVFSILK